MNVHRNIHHDKLLFDNKLIDDFFKGEHTHDSEHSTFMFKIPFDQFTDLTCINKGGFSAIYKATWKCDHENEIDVVLKVIEDTKNMDSAFLNELMVYTRCGKNFSDLHFQEIYGICRDPKTKKFIIVMKLALHGDLHHFLLNNINILSWQEKLNILKFIAWSLMNLHQKDIIHCDFHSGNILINDDGCAKISDFGVSKLADMSYNHNQIYGIIPYVAPEVLEHGHYTKQSDIYSLGMIMWEVINGCKPFCDREYDAFLILEIIYGLRPKFIDGTPQELIDLIEKCWNYIPSKRPTANEIMNDLDFITQKEIQSADMNNEGIDISTLFFDNATPM
ncbi:kinase-like domain-containing protein [Gigaspora rosea]|uniref:Kinase-like domain-containing protein n=1 Tax=Gigaspora rosea TaxID=44941 RepID=A0A397TYG9_9GLOM|nr:kinase-like domain-containing protein [Gigaspora rosea]